MNTEHVYDMFYLAICSNVCVCLAGSLIAGWSYANLEWNHRRPSQRRYEKSDFDAAFATRMARAVHEVELERAMTALCEGSREPVVCDDLFGLRLASDDVVQRLLDDSRFQKGKVVSRLHQCRHLFDSMNATNAFGVSACYSSLSADMTRFASAYQKRAPLCTWMSQIDLLETDMLMDGMRKIRLEGSLYLLNGGSTTLLNYAHHSKYMPFILLPLLNNKRPDVCYSVQQRRALLRAAIWWFRNKTMDLDNLLLTKVAILKRFAEKPSDMVSLKVEACEYSSTCHGRTLGCTATCFGRQLLQCTNYCLCCVNVPVSGGHLARRATFTPNRRWPLVAGATVSETIICQLSGDNPSFPSRVSTTSLSQQTLHTNFIFCSPAIKKEAFNAYVIRKRCSSWRKSS